MDFPFLNRTDGGKDPLPSRTRIVQSFPNIIMCLSALVSKPENLCLNGFAELTIDN